MSVFCVLPWARFRTAAPELVFSRTCWRAFIAVRTAAVLGAPVSSCNRMLGGLRLFCIPGIIFIQDEIHKLACYFLYQYDYTPRTPMRG